MFLAATLARHFSHRATSPSLKVCKLPSFCKPSFAYELENRGPGKIWSMSKLIHAEVRIDMDMDWHGWFNHFRCSRFQQSCWWPREANLKAMKARPTLATFHDWSQDEVDVLSALNGLKTDLNKFFFKKKKKTTSISKLNSFNNFIKFKIQNDCQHHCMDSNMRILHVNKAHHQKIVALWKESYPRSSSKALRVAQSARAVDNS